MHGQKDYASMHRIHLWGALRKQFGPEYTLRVETVREATRALGMMVAGFGEAVVKGHFRIVLGDKDTGRLITEAEVGGVLPVGVDVHIVPAVVGSGGGHGMGIGKIIIGVILMVASWWAGGSAGIAYLGAQGAATVSAMGMAVGMSLVMSGVTQLLSPQAKAQQQQQQQNSFGFNGVQNNTQQGVAVPLVYGTFMTGSVAVSQGISTRQLMN